MIERETFHFRLISFPFKAEGEDFYNEYLDKAVYRIEKKKLFSQKYKPLLFNDHCEMIVEREKANKVYDSVLKSNQLVKLFLRITNQPIKIKNL